MTAAQVTDTAAAPCTATAPDLWTVPCTQPNGHDGPHRNNQTTWRDPATPDLTTDTDHWVDGNVRLTEDASA